MFPYFPLICDQPRSVDKTKLLISKCLSTKDISSALLLAKKALNQNPKYVEYEYRKEQLWGTKLQTSTKKLFKNDQLQEDIRIAKLKLNQNS